MTIILDTVSRIAYILGVARVKSQSGLEKTNQVRAQRRGRDMTQAQLASLVEVSRQTVVSIEAGDYSPSVHLALRIAESLDTTVEELFGPAEEAK